MTGKNITKANIYRKVSHIAVPFWGLAKNQIEQLSNEPLDFYVRFDYNKGSILLTSEQVNVLLADKVPAQDGDYKIVLKDLEPFAAIK